MGVVLLRKMCVFKYEAVCGRNGLRWVSGTILLL